MSRRGFMPCLIILPSPSEGFNMALVTNGNSIKDILDMIDGLKEDAVAAQEVLVDIDLPSLRQIASGVIDRLGGSLQFVFAVDERPGSDGFSLHHVFGISARHCFLHVRSEVPTGSLEFPSLTPILPSANWHERKIADMHGLIPVDHPDPRRLVLHEDWPDGLSPLNYDFDASRPVPRVAGEYMFQRIEGEGIFEIPVGPVHAGIIEPGHFRFSSIGEKILYLELRLFYKYRGVERYLQGKSLLGGVLAAERISGDETVANAVAYCQAVERIAGIDIPERAKRLRAVLQELERIHCHLADIAGAATDVAFSAGAAKAAILRERVMAINETVSGSRFLRGVIVHGGLRRDIDNGASRGLLDFADASRNALNELKSSIFDRSSVLDRFERTGALSKSNAVDLAVVGPVARASGIPTDARIDYPYGFYELYPLEIAVRNDGDVAARVRIKFDEIERSLQIIEDALCDIQSGDICAKDTSLPSSGHGLGWAEAPRGLTLCWVEIGDDGRIVNCRWRTPSFNNWPALPYALEGDIVPDFPLVNKSFNLSYAGNDL